MKLSPHLLGGLLALHALSSSQAAVTYVDADASNVTRWDGTAFSPTSGGAGGAADDNWHQRTGFANGSNVLTSNETGSEDAPMLIVTLTGLTPGVSYSVFGYFWSNTDSWRLKGTVSNSVSASDANLPWPTIGVDGNNDNILDNASPANLSDDLIDNHPEVSWSRAGSGTSAAGTNLGSLDTNADNLSDSYFSTGILVTEGNRTLYESGFGQIAADGSGEISIYIDDLRSQTSSSNRTWFDGVGFEAIPEPGSAALCLLAGTLVGLRRRR